jgi:hypothetical protein
MMKMVIVRHVFNPPETTKTGDEAGDEADAG